MTGLISPAATGLASSAARSAALRPVTTMLADVPLSTLSSATCACASAGWTPSSVELSRHVRNVSLSLEDIILPPLCDGAVGFDSRHYSIASHQDRQSTRLNSSH